ncbi:hypothetical protein LZ32DRAFT_259104 [Colletotrichum eremochloae]|nr:hypothetical protein LZ32DRAFT_259104 [Colletotrichum eremochloae]
MLSRHHDRIGSRFRSPKKRALCCVRKHHSSSTPFVVSKKHGPELSTRGSGSGHTCFLPPAQSNRAGPSFPTKVSDGPYMVYRSFPSASKAQSIMPHPVQVKRNVGPLVNLSISFSLMSTRPHGRVRCYQASPESCKLQRQNTSRQRREGEHDRISAGRTLVKTTAGKTNLVFLSLIQNSKSATPDPPDPFYSGTARAPRLPSVTRKARS